ncbi:MAG: hypothetical protein Athens041674_481 [Parcubacteria group bacterium Athens0416_74]|nr:MAG: hypothetical protein Athens041674_481 [Parcubacteria group bacterium Athens0416_74]
MSRKHTIHTLKFVAPILMVKFEHDWVSLSAVNTSLVA